ncbi:hypothetical protein [Streptomyces sp. NPDC007369]|uniref:hypothetical protein n=1 Tax=Streptomyces sp. NPDC007369 TaxID=3154589 RepID=UPI0033C06837
MISDRFATSRDGFGQYKSRNQATGQCLTIRSVTYPHGLLSTKRCQGSGMWHDEPTTIDGIDTSWNSVHLRGLGPPTNDRQFCIGNTDDRAYAQVCDSTKNSQKWRRI